MRLVVLDTNVLVAAGINPEGTPASIVMDWVLEKRVIPVVCPAVETEYLEVMSRRKFSRFGFPPFWLAGLLTMSLRIDDPPPWPIWLSDPKDAPFLALAKAAGAVLVTGNLRHFPPEACSGVVVVSPTEYLERLAQ